MLDTHINTDFLEDLWLDDCKCESAHDFPVLECSGKVVGRKTVACGGFGFMICGNSYDFNLKSISRENRTCSDCDRLTSECWTIRPI